MIQVLIYLGEAFGFLLFESGQSRTYDKKMCEIKAFMSGWVVCACHPCPGEVEGSLHT